MRSRRKSKSKSHSKSSTRKRSLPKSSYKQRSLNKSIYLEKRRRTNSINPKRKSPNESATGFRAGTIRIGNDGNPYKIVIVKGHTKRWIRVKEFK